MDRFKFPSDPALGGRMRGSVRMPLPLKPFKLTRRCCAQCVYAIGSALVRGNLQNPIPWRSNGMVWVFGIILFDRPSSFQRPAPQARVIILAIGPLLVITLQYHGDSLLMENGLFLSSENKGFSVAPLLFAPRSPPCMLHAAGHRIGIE